MFSETVKHNVDMTAPRRMGTENSKTRQILLDIAERLMVEEGYAAVGVRRVAREAGVTPALVLYCFRTLDDLLLALLRRRAEDGMERQAHIISSNYPLRALWDLNHHSPGQSPQGDRRRNLRQRGAVPQRAIGCRRPVDSDAEETRGLSRARAGSNWPITPILCARECRR